METNKEEVVDGIIANLDLVFREQNQKQMAFNSIKSICQYIRLANVSVSIEYQSEVTGRYAVSRCKLFLGGKFVFSFSIRNSYNWDSNDNWVATRAIYPGYGEYRTTEYFDFILKEFDLHCSVPEVPEPKIGSFLRLQSPKGMFGIGQLGWSPFPEMRFETREIAEEAAKAFNDKNPNTRYVVCEPKEIAVMKWQPVDPEFPQVDVVPRDTNSSTKQSQADGRGPITPEDHYSK